MHCPTGGGIFSGANTTIVPGTSARQSKFQYLSVLTSRMCATSKGLLMPSLSDAFSGLPRLLELFGAPFVFCLRTRWAEPSALARASRLCLRHPFAVDPGNAQLLSLHRFGPFRFNRIQQSSYHQPQIRYPLILPRAKEKLPLP